MKLILTIFALLTLECSVAQEFTYSISAPPGVREGVGSKQLPDSIDQNHYYSYTEIRELAKPLDGWDNFYRNMETFEYPKDAKERKLQSAMTVAFQINENGQVDSVFIKSVDPDNGNLTKCKSCEELILDYFSNTKWSAGKIGEVPVKTTDDVFILFTIHNTNN
jgi:hypothetical protein